MMKTSVKYGIKRPIWHGGDWKIGIAPFRVKKNNLNLFCMYRRSKSKTLLWEGLLWVNESFCKKYPIVEYHGKFGKFSVYQIPLADIQEFNIKIQDKIWKNKNSNVTSPVYSGEQIAEILKNEPKIREIADMFGGGELYPK